MTTLNAEKLGPFLVGDRPMPQSMEAEKAVLSCLLIDPSSTMDLVFSKISNEASFYFQPHQRIYTCLKEMRGEMVPNIIDLITVTDKLEQKRLLEQVGGEEYLSHLVNILPTTANIEMYIESVLDAYILRNMIMTCSEVVSRCLDANDNVQELIDLIERKVLEVTELRTDIQVRPIRDLMKGAIVYLEDLSKNKQEAVGIPTGFDIDKKITGLKPGELIVLAARPSIGKTALSLDIARNVAIGSGNAVGIFSLEMGNNQVVLRLLCGEARINLKDVRDGKLTQSQWANDIMSAAGKLSSAPIYIDDTAQISAVELRQKARRMKQDYNIQLVIIDYLQLMRPVGINKSTSREQEVAKLSADIKSLAKELDIPILLLCQLNRQAEQGNQPKLSNLRESGAIEQDADIVMLLHRERELDRDLNQSMDQENVEGIESKLIIAKNRNGETGIVNLSFKPEWTRFFDSTYISNSDVPPNASF